MGYSILGVMRIRPPDDQASVRICLTVMQGTWKNLINVAESADRCGLHGIGVSDSPLLERDVYLACAAAALNTNHVDIVTGVTNPVTRHPSVAAAAFAQLNELAPGRVVCGVATGDSAVWGVGLKPAKVETLRKYILALKRLCRGERTTWCGNSFAPRWRSFEPFDLPVYVACAGPKTVRMAAQAADGLILSVGVSAEDLQWVEAQIDDACREIGRDPLGVDVWHYTEILFAESEEAAAARSLGSFSRWLTHGGTTGKRIPAEYLPALEALNAERQSIDNSYAAEDAGAVTVHRAKELGIYDWLVSRSACLAGPVKAIGERLEVLRDRGVNKWMLYPGSRYEDDALIARRLGEVIAQTGNRPKPGSCLSSGVRRDV